MGSHIKLSSLSLSTASNVVVSNRDQEGTDVVVWLNNISTNVLESSNHFKEICHHGVGSGGTISSIETSLKARSESVREFRIRLSKLIE